MPSADRVPVKSPHSMMHWHMWVVPMQHQTALLFGRLGLGKPHIGPGHRFADGLGVGGIILLPLDVGLHLGRRHQAHGVPKRLELTRPMMRRGAGLNANQARLQLLKERHDIAAL